MSNATLTNARRDGGRVPSLAQGDRMRRVLLTVILSCLGMAAWAVPAHAHFLSQQRAQNRAVIEANAFMDSSDDYWLADCWKRLSAHRRRCLIASYDEDSDITCDAYVNVRFRSGWSYRTIAGSWYGIRCYDGDAYELAR
jgi:hypothetical protein